MDGYLVLETDTIVGTCAFRSPPRSGEVEIAYFTFPEFEGRGFTTEMARHLIQIVKDTQSGTRIFAFTLPEKSFQPYLAEIGIRFRRRDA